MGPLNTIKRSISTPVLEVAPEIWRSERGVAVGFKVSTRDHGQLCVHFEMEDLPWPTDRAATEAMLIASIALAMQQGSVLRVKGKVSRSLRHTIDLYQEACAWWFPERYRRIEIEAEVLDDLAPTTARGVLCFSAGLDSIFSGKELAAARQAKQHYSSKATTSIFPTKKAWQNSELASSVFCENYLFRNCLPHQCA